MHRVAFVHVPKTGGSTLHKLLLGHFRPEEVCPERFQDLRRFSMRELAGFNLFSGHFDLDAAKWVPGRKLVISVVREPRARIISLYNFWRSHTWNYIEKHGLEGPRMAKSVSFTEFLTRAGTNVDNAMARAIIGPDYERLSEDDKIATLDARMTEVDAFGLTERLEESVRRIFHKLERPVPLRVPRVNSSDKFLSHPGMERISPIEITDEAEAAIKRLTTLDRRLYEAVASTFDHESSSSVIRAVRRPFRLLLASR
jgi:hypothetical protein